MARKTFLFTGKQITQDNQAFLFSALGLADENITLPVFINPPIMNIISVQADAIVNLHPDNPPTKDGFTVIIGSVGQVPSVADPIIFSFEIITQDDITTVVGAKNLVTPSFVKERFPNWSTYATRADGLKSADEMLQLAIDEAGYEFCAYFKTLTEILMTDELRMHLLNIVKKNLFDFLHGDSGYKHKPQIVLDYKATKDKLDRGLIVTDSVRMDAKDRQFEDGEWFTDNSNLWFE